jgi:hypothetical protein
VSGFLSSIYLILFFVFIVGMALVWYYRVITLTENFLKIATKLLSDAQRMKSSSGIFYRKEELSGTYKGREVVIGIEHTGIKSEFMAIPCIQMRLKAAMGYNLNRLPHYATLDKKMVVYKVSLNVLWGIFDKNYPQVFSQSFLIMSLERLLSTAEDLERGRTSMELKF